MGSTFTGDIADVVFNGEQKRNYTFFPFPISEAQNFVKSSAVGISGRLSLLIFGIFSRMMENRKKNDKRRNTRKT